MSADTPDPRPGEEHRQIVGEGVRRTVGIAAMRRMHRMIAAEKETEARNARVVRIAGAACAIAALATVVWMALH